MNRRQVESLAGEFIGTFGIVFPPVALSASSALSGSDSTLGAAAWVSGLAVLAMIYAFGHVSGAHFNPAVSIALARSGCFPWRSVPVYIVAQLLGSVCAVGTATLLYGRVGGTHIPAVPAWNGFLLEAVLSALLMFIILGTATDRRAVSGIAGVAIGLVVVMDVYLGGAATGGSMNPARSFGPAVFAGGVALQNLWLYVVAPVVGMLAATFVYDRMRHEPCCAVESNASTSAA